MRILFVLFFVLISISPSFSETISGTVRQDEFLNKKSTVVDFETEKPIEGAKIYIPNYDFFTTTDKNGKFELNAAIDDNAILQVEHEGYRPFSITVDKTTLNSPLRLGIEKVNPMDAYIEQGVFHLGDNIYSANSANCLQFKARSLGPYYTKTIKLPFVSKNKQVVIVFGSVIGLDTKMAKELGQNAIVSVYSSPLEIIFNGHKIGELNINGDNQQVVVPNSLVKATNELLIKTGKNLFQKKYSDYDDMEFANLRVEVRDKVF